MTRRLHPGAWWTWALTVGAISLQTTNLILLGLLAAIVWAVLVTCRRADDDSSAMKFFVALGVVIIVFRIVIEILVGNTGGDRVLLSIPEADLPDWMAGITIGGDFTFEALVAAFARGCQLAVMLAAFGVVNVLCSPYRLLRLLPTALHELSVATSVALSSAPHAALHVQRLHRARRLRGRPSGGIHAVRHLAVPVLEHSLDQSITLAASMDVRGFGRTQSIDTADRRKANLAMGIGFVSAALGIYGLLAAGTPRAFGAVGFSIAVVALLWSFRVLSRATRRTRLAAEAWDGRAWAVALTAIVAFAAMLVANSTDPLSLVPPALPLSLPSTPVWLVVGCALLIIPAVVAPGASEEMA